MVSKFGEVLFITYGLISLPLFDVSHTDFMLESLCRLLSNYFLRTFYLYFLYDFVCRL